MSALLLSAVLGARRKTSVAPEKITKSMLVTEHEEYRR
jgi:hypothetical protein